MKACTVYRTVCRIAYVYIFGSMSDEGGELGGSKAAGGVDRVLRQFSHAMRRLNVLLPFFLSYVKEFNHFFINKCFS